ncbi:MAG TPA: acetate/propionate family kinase [Acetobacteraceae bacterium]|nr:acetate/propionate family kinase [Acetobacteraceae bacterium]
MNANETNRRLCVLNAGSSSLKFGVYGIGGGLHQIQAGAVDGIGGRARLRVATADGKPVHEAALDAPDHAAALDALAAVPDGPLAREGLVAFGHRVVHGGSDMSAPVVVNAATLARIEALSPLAPLHNPPAATVLRALGERFAGVMQVACFDTAFHRGHPAVADRFAIPDALYHEGVRRYGFHGLSYEYIAGALAAQVPEIALGRVVVAHLGSGASMCALAGGRSVDSSMGFTALDGLPMGTRSGSLDAGVILWLQQQKGWSVDRVERFLYEECGLQGLSGVSNDMRTLLASEAPLAKLAVAYFVYHVVRTAGSLAASMGGIDGMVFTAGIGEHSPEIRERVLRRLRWLGFVLDEAANQAAGPRLTRADSSRQAYVIPTDEEIVIARHTLALLDAA